MPTAENVALFVRLSEGLYTHSLRIFQTDFYTDLL